MRRSSALKYLPLFLFPLFVWLPAEVNGQTLPLKEAIRLGLENNFDLKVVRTEARLAAEGNTWGIAGFLPNASLTGNRNFQWNNISQRFSNGIEVERDGVASNQANAALGVSWILYDGGRMFIAKDRQNKTQSLADLRVQNQILGFVDSLSAAYLQLVQAAQEITIARQESERTKERLKIATEQLRIGFRPKSDVLLATIDLNTVENRIRNQETQLELRKGIFNQLLGRDPEVPFDVENTIEEVPKAIWQEIKARVQAQNPALQIQNRNLEISRLSIKEIKARAYPQINLNSAYTFGRTQSKAGFALFNQNLGPSIGFSASLPLYTGVSVKKLSQLANTNLEIQQLQTDLFKSRLVLQVWRALKTLEIHQQTADTETKNLQLALENNDIIKERFRLGQSTSLELKDAELQVSGASLRQTQARIQAKLAANQILRLTGELKW